MTAKTTRWVAVLLLGCGLIAAKQPALATGGPGAGRLNIFVSILPQAFFVERIGGDQVVVQVLVGPGESPAAFDLTPRTLVLLARAQVYFTIGVPMETILRSQISASFPGLEVIDMAAGLTRSPASSGAAHTEAGHFHEDDPHVWLSPRLARTLARNVGVALSRLDPDHADLYEQNLSALLADLEKLDTDLSEILAPVAGAELLVFHPAYGYLAADHDLRQVAVETGGLAPTPRHLVSVLNLARKSGVRAIFVQPQVSTATAARLAAEAGLQLVELDPLARDYLANLRRLAVTIRDALLPPSPETER